MVEISQALKNYIDGLDKRDVRLRGAGRFEIGTDIFETLALYGVAIPTAYAFALDGKGVLLAGNGEPRRKQQGIPEYAEESYRPKGLDINPNENENGKSSIAGKFAELHRERVVVLAEKNPTLYQPHPGTDTLVYLDDVKSQEVPFFAPFLPLDSPEEFESFPLRYVFHLKQSAKIRLHQAAKGSAFYDDMFQWTRTREANLKLRKMFEHVQCYEVLAPYQLTLSGQDGVSQRFEPASHLNLERIVRGMAERIR